MTSSESAADHDGQVHDDLDEHAATSRAERLDMVSGLGPRLRAARVAANLSLRQFAKQLGVSPSFVSQFETGKSQPSVATLYQICSELDLSIDELFSNTAASRSAPDQPAAPVSPVAPAPASSAPISTAPIGDQHPPLTRPADRSRLVLDSGVVWESLTQMRSSAVDFLYVTYDVGGSSTLDERLTRHNGIEYGYVLSGDLEVRLGFDRHLLGAGDAISFDSATPHRLTNVGDVPVTGIWFVLGRGSSHGA